MERSEPITVWNRLREYAATQSGPFTSQEALTWFRRHAPSQANDRTVRTHIRGACWNVDDGSQFSTREPFLTRIDRGLFRRATNDELNVWRGDNVDGAETRDRHRRLGKQPEPDVLGASSADASSTDKNASEGEWHTEANVQALLVTALTADGWSIHSVANTATKEHGIDVIASRDGEMVGVEVKGFPSRGYADPARAAEHKRTSPSTQAGHWYSQAVLAAMRLRGKEPTWRSAIAFPDFPRYRNLHRETADSLTATSIEVWWIDAQGGLQRS